MVVSNDDGRLAPGVERRPQLSKVVAGHAVERELELLPGKQLQPALQSASQAVDKRFQRRIVCKEPMDRFTLRCIDIDADITNW